MLFQGPAIRWFLPGFGPDDSPRLEPCGMSVWVCLALSQKLSSTDGWVDGRFRLCCATRLSWLPLALWEWLLICRNILALKPNCRLPTTAARLGVLEGNMDRLWGRVKRVEDRVDRLYAQGKVFTINASGLDQVWGDVGDAATAGALADRGGDLAEANL